MQRVMRGVHQDPQGDWVAELDCGHTQPLPQQPPAPHDGQPLECPLCERRVLPAGHAPYRRTPSFGAGSIPDGLLRQHSTKPGVWALLHVSAGSLEFVELVGGAEQRQALGAGEHAVIRPGVEHRVVPLGEVEFSVEFWRAANAPEPGNEQSSP